jgi:hypothetical protein
MNSDTMIQGIGLIGLPVLGFLIGWMITMQRNIDTHKLNVAENYAKKNDLSTALTKIETVLEKIFDRIDRLADRRECERNGEQQ